MKWFIFSFLCFMSWIFGSALLAFDGVIDFLKHALLSIVFLSLFLIWYAHYFQTSVARVKNRRLGFLMALICTSSTVSVVGFESITTGECPFDLQSNKTSILGKLNDFALDVGLCAEYGTLLFVVGLATVMIFLKEIRKCV